MPNFEAAMNPIVVRESRARWRGLGAFWLLLGYTGVLAIALFWRYVEASSSGGQSKSPLDRIELLGHELFLTLIWMQSLAWALIGPAITATSIAGERESGMLEAVQLSPLSPWQIIIGKLISALSFIALLLLVSLPITATCFLMGGVSPEEFLAALTLHATTAFTGAALGLACSAWSRKANIAMRSAYVLAIGWLIASSLSFAAAIAPTVLGTPMAWAWQFACAIFGWSNPIIATAAIVDARAMGSSGAMLAGLGIFETSPWMISVVFQLLLSALLLWSATRALKRPFSEQYWLDAKKILEVPAADIALSAPAPAGGSTPSAPPAALLKSGNHGAKEWWLIPVFSQLVFANPVLQRETRSKFRMRQPPFWVIAFEACLALFVAYFYLRALWGALFIRDEREIIWWIICFVALTVVALTSAVSGANAFTREREIRTWESLRLSLLSSREIVSAKLGAVLIGFAVFTLPTWPLLLPCIRHLWKHDEQREGVSLVQALLCFSLIAATGICYTLWGMFWSWRCRKTTSATGWTLGSLFFALVFAPAFLLTAFSGSSGDITWNFYNPFVSMGIAADGNELGISVATIVFLCMAAGILWLRLATELSRE